MAEMHPEDVELLGLVEDDLAAERRSAVSAHVAGCARCAESVRLLEAGKATLRQAPRLELAPQRREAIVAGLPRRPARRRRFAGRAIAVLAPVAAVVALAVTLASLDLGGGDEEAAAPPAREQAATAEAEAGEPAGGEDPSALRAVTSVAGPAAEVAELLRRRGFDARVVGEHVEVRNADPEAVERALARRRPGPVRVVVR